MKLAHNKRLSALKGSRISGIHENRDEEPTRNQRTSLPNHARRVPHVRQSVHGPKTIFFKCFRSMFHQNPLEGMILLRRPKGMFVDLECSDLRVQS